MISPLSTAALWAYFQVNGINYGAYFQVNGINYGAFAAAPAIVNPLVSVIVNPKVCHRLS